MSIAEVFAIPSFTFVLNRFDDVKSSGHFTRVNQKPAFSRGRLAFGWLQYKAFWRLLHFQRASRACRRNLSRSDFGITIRPDLSIITVIPFMMSLSIVNGKSRADTEW